MKVPDRLQPLVDDGVVTEIVRPLMSGKEASLYYVIAGGIPCAAKVYKDAEHRSFRHRAGYAEGRRVRNSRQQRAMAKGTRFGKEMMESAWQNAEVDALFRLSAAGLRVPTPHMYSDGVLLMDLIVDEHGEPAPRLWDVELTPELARQLHETLIRELVYLLCAGMVHGDLSEYNVLLAYDGPIMIDFPQATEAAANPNSRSLFLRDAHNVTNFLARAAPELAETRFGEEIWSLYERAALFPDTPLTGRWRGSERKADTRAVLGEIETAARDARRKREFEGIPERPRRRKAEPPPAARSPSPKPDAPRTSRSEAPRPARRDEPAPTTLSSQEIDDLLEFD